MTDADRLMKDLSRPWRHGEHVDGRNAIVEKPLILDGLDIRGFDLSGATFKAGLSARGTRFRGLAWLRGAQVCGPCDLTGAQFRTDLRADDLVADSLYLDECELQGVLSLARSRLQRFSLRKALIMANLTLEDAHIQSSNLSGTEILGGLWTAGATLVGFQPEDAAISGRLQLPG